LRVLACPARTVVPDWQHPPLVAARHSEGDVGVAGLRQAICAKDLSRSQMPLRKGKPMVIVRGSDNPARAVRVTAFDCGERAPSRLLDRFRGLAVRSITRL